MIAVPNISEGRDDELILEIAGTDCLIDADADFDHNRTVLTYVGRSRAVISSVVEMASRATEKLDLRTHSGVHPRFGAVDVIPFVIDLAAPQPAGRAADECAELLQQRDLRVARYSERFPLPQLRRDLANAHAPDTICVGTRPPLIAFNVNLDEPLEVAKNAARQIRGQQVRALGFLLSGKTQVSMNLIDPDTFSISDAYQSLQALGLNIVEAQIVGLVSARYIAGTESLPLTRELRTLEQAQHEGFRGLRRSG